MRQFYLHARKGIYYVQFVNVQTKKCGTALSTGKDNRDDALIVASEWLKDGIPASPTQDTQGSRKSVSHTLQVDQIVAWFKEAELAHTDVARIGKILKDRGLVSVVIQPQDTEAELFEDFITRFWDYNQSPYVEEKLGHKLRIGKTHTKLCLERAKRHWIPYFKGKSIGAISFQDIKEFSNDLARTNPDFSSLTLKHILTVGTVALRWAYHNKKIPGNPTEGLISFSSKTKKRGILTLEEARQLFRLPCDERARLASLTAMTTGLRIGEILGLRMEDIGQEYLKIENSYSRADGLKCTKTDEARLVPIIPQIRDALIQLGQTNPHDNRFIFYCEKLDRPWDQEMPALALKKMLLKMKVGERPRQDTSKAELEEWEAKRDEAIAYWKKRNVVFHSWRHFYAARMADRIEARKVMLATGHKMEAVFREYADHALETDLSEVARITSKVFEGLLPERIGGNQ